MELLITFLLGLFFIVGIVIVKLSHGHAYAENISISVATGALIALSVFDLIPEIIESYEGIAIIWGIIFTLLGLFILKVIDGFIPDHHTHHHHHDHEHDDLGSLSTTPDKELIHIGIMSGLALILHNILEGGTVYNIASISISSGISLGVGVGLHNIPLGMLIYATLKNEKPLQKYLILSLSVISTFIGGLLMFVASPFLTESILSAFTCITLGMVLYIVIFELIPSIIEGNKKLLSILLAALGFIIVVLSQFF